MNIQVNGVNKVLNRIHTLQNGLQAKMQTLLERLADKGVEIAEAKFSLAQYDGTKDVTVSWAKENENKLVITASGTTVAFIEFGTGVHYTEVHPKATEFGATRGSYGKHKGLNDSWGYYGEPGTNGREVVKKNGKIVVITHGNPPARAMYDTGKELRNEIMNIAKEVFA